MTLLDEKQILTRGFDFDNNVHKVTLTGDLKAPANTDAITVEYPNTSTEIFRFRNGGTAGIILKSVQIIYTNASKSDLLSVEVI